MIIGGNALTGWNLSNLEHVGGNIRVHHNDHLSTWPGFSNDIRIDGALMVHDHRLLTDDDIESWADDDAVTVGGDIRICRNGDDDGCPCSLDGQ